MKDPQFISRFGLSVNAAAAQCTTVQSGGNTDFFLEVTDTEVWPELLKEAESNSLYTRIVGAGSRSVISDFGYRGLLIKNSVKYIDLNRHSVKVGSGALVSALVQKLAADGYGGFEELVGEAGSVGGALASSEPTLLPLRQCLKSVELWLSGELQTLTNTQFQALTGKPGTILNATFEITPMPAAELTRRMLTATQTKLRQKPGGVPCVQVFAAGEATDLLNQLAIGGEQVGGATVSRKDPNYIINENNARSHDVYELAQRMRHRVKVKLNHTLAERINWLGEW